MDEQDIRMAIDRHWAASAAVNQIAEHKIYHDDAVCEYPQSGKVIRGRRNLQALRSDYTGNPPGWLVGWAAEICGRSSRSPRPG